MYRCPLSIKYKNLLIYSEVTIILNWEIYLVLIHIQTGGRQIDLISATFPVDCTWHPKLSFFLLDITKD